MSVFCNAQGTESNAAWGATGLLWLSGFDVPRGGPGNASDQGCQEDIVAKRVVRVAVCGSKNPSLTELVGPEDRLDIAGFFAFGRRKNLGVWPNFLDDVKFVHRGFVIGWNGLGDRVVFIEDGDRIVALVFVMTARDP